MTEVRDITRRELTLARSVINSSVMPSEKYSWEGSPDRLASGRTAMERTEEAALMGWESARTFQRADTTTTKSIPTARTARMRGRAFVRVGDSGASLAGSGCIGCLGRGAASIT